MNITVNRIAEINNLDLKPGDKVLFRRGGGMVPDGG
jgi:NAD-dependent DNA ligase